MQVERPWESEVVPVSWEAHGYSCHILRGPGGQLNGYVRLPESHPLYEVAYTSEVPEALALASKAVLEGPVGKRGPIEILLLAMRGHCTAGDLFNVHGSITFSGTLKGLKDFWYGFDCAHAGDLSPESYDRYPQFRHGYDVYRDLPYVTSETESLALQLKQLEELTS